ncbi:MAG: ATP synthase F1 subunit gamma [Candidatus Kapabacteria bacterium]|nr:ATP synthase F1 subunit gamma [Ignavibacteriota bacterium]MCW5886057.1 ATP synthase F1 subunit gamma [Candidatus Kapabacteria bacterium]
MATLRDIRNRIKGVKNTAKITSAMKMVSTAKLKRAQNAIESARPYFEKLDMILSNVSSTLGSDYTNPLLRQSDDVKNILLIVVTSDRGLCGSFNTNLLKEAVHLLNNQFPKDYPSSQTKVIAIGKKAVSFFKKRHYFVAAEFQGIFSELNFTIAQEIVNAYESDFIEAKYDKIMILGNEFITVMKQEPRLRNILPIVSGESITIGKQKKEEKTTADYIFEPDKKAILDDLLPKLVNIKIWRSILESNAAEQAARRFAMDNATRNAKELISMLELQYNKARQASITTEMLEIVGGAEALRAH